VHEEKLNSWRISLTLPVIEAARHIFMLVAGEAKADIVRDVLYTSSSAARFPIHMIKPSAEIEWYIDAAAARKLGDFNAPQNPA
jgi:6-phosphogluconolactonase